MTKSLATDGGFGGGWQGTERDRGSGVIIHRACVWEIHLVQPWDARVTAVCFVWRIRCGISHRWSQRKYTWGLATPPVATKPVIDDQLNNVTARILTCPPPTDPLQHFFIPLCPGTSQVSGRQFILLLLLLLTAVLPTCGHWVPCSWLLAHLACPGGPSSPLWSESRWKQPSLGRLVPHVSGINQFSPFLGTLAQTLFSFSNMQGLFAYSCFVSSTC